jgi:hypothetical protein
LARAELTINALAPERVDVPRFECLTHVGLPRFDAVHLMLAAGGAVGAVAIGLWVCRRFRGPLVIADAALIIPAILFISSSRTA